MTDPIRQEIASIERDPYVPAYQRVLTPTDAVALSKGRDKGLDLYDEVRRDPHVFTLLQKRSLEVVSREILVTPASERRRDTQAAALVERQLKGLGLDRLTRALLGGAILKGFAVGEAMWTPIAGEWTVTAVRVKKQRRFRFDTDGNLRLITRADRLLGELLPDRKFIVHRHSIEDDDDDPYGVGMGQILFWPAWFKREVLAHWLQASERFASPTIKATYEGEVDETRERQILTTIRALARDAGLVLPQSVEVDLLEATRGGGGDLLEKLSRYLDELMSTAVLGESLTTSAGDNGSRALGEVHNDVRVAIAKADADLVSATLNESLVKWIVDVNMPGAGYPQVWRDFSEVEDLDKKVQRDRTIFGMGYKPASVDYINETYGGDWVEKPEPEQGGASKAKAAAAVAAAFAEGAASDPVSPLVDQAEVAGDPAIRAMLDRIRAAFAEARDYDDLIARMAQLSGGLDPADLVRVLEQAIELSELTGRAEVQDGR